MKQLVLGIDLGGTDTKFAIVDNTGAILRKEKFPTETHRSIDGVMSLMAERARYMIGDDPVLAIGLAVPAPVSSSDGILYQPPNLGPEWRAVKSVPVKDLFYKYLGLDLPIILNNDANAAAWGEYWCGAGSDAKTMIMFTLGSGVGGGIVVDGKLFEGGDGAAGELGHMIVEMENGAQCGCGNKGCLEAYASATAIKRMVGEALDRGEKTSIAIPPEGLGHLRAKEVFDAAQQGDTVAAAIIAKMTSAIGVACGTIINIFNPDMIVFSGGIAAAGDYLFNPVREKARSIAFERPSARAKIVPAILGNDAGIIGAAGMAFVALGK